MASSSHNHQNSATRGGASSIQTPANSGGSGLFGGSSVGATNDPAGITTHQSPTTGILSTNSGTHKSTSTDEGKRRSSQESGSLFGNLNTLKRNSEDQTTSTRKASLSGQAATPGVIGSMWQSWTKGT